MGYTVTHHLNDCSRSEETLKQVAAYRKRRKIERDVATTMASRRLTPFHAKLVLLAANTVQHAQWLVGWLVGWVVRVLFNGTFTHIWQYRALYITSYNHTTNL